MSILQQLLDELQEKEMLTKAPANVNTATLLTQPGGIFSVAGADNVVINSYVKPTGLGARLPIVTGATDDPRYQFISGFTIEAGARPTNPCDDAPAGFMKGGNLTAAWGRVVHQTQTIEIDKILHEQRGASTDLRLMGMVLNADQMSPVNSQEGILNNVVAAEMIGVGVQFERDMSKLLWQGSPANNTANGGHMEFPGLDSQIATGQVDADTGVAMPAADSYIADFNYQAIDGVARDIVAEVSFMHYYLSELASSTGLDPVEWVLVMPRNLWYEVSAVWPCRYMTNRCAVADGTNPMVINDDANVRERDRLRGTMVLPVNGVDIPVVVDDGINVYNNTNNANVPAGSFASSIYLVPVRIRQSFPSMYWEHIDYRRIAPLTSVMGQGVQNLQFWTDNGRYLWVIRPDGYCFDLQAKIEARAVLRTPHLAGKLQRILYAPLAHLRMPFADSPYNYDGGPSVRSVPTLGQAVWR